MICQSFSRRPFPAFPLKLWPIGGESHVSDALTYISLEKRFPQRWLTSACCRAKMNLDKHTLVTGGTRKLKQVDLANDDAWEASANSVGFPRPRRMKVQR